MRSPCCLSICESTLSTFECLNQSFWNLVCIPCHLSPFQRLTWWNPLISLCVCMCSPPFIARQRLGKHVPTATNTHATLEELLEPYVCIPLPLLRNTSIQTYPRKRRIFGSVVFSAVRVISNKSRSVLSRTSSLLYMCIFRHTLQLCLLFN
jgi:hypothetical protein